MASPPDPIVALLKVNLGCVGDVICMVSSSCRLLTWPNFGSSILSLPFPPSRGLFRWHRCEVYWQIRQKTRASSFTVCRIKISASRTHPLGGKGKITSCSIFPTKTGEHDNRLGKFANIGARNGDMCSIFAEMRNDSAHPLLHIGWPRVNAFSYFLRLIAAHFNSCPPMVLPGGTRLQGVDERDLALPNGRGLVLLPPKSSRFPETCVRHVINLSLLLGV